MANWRTAKLGSGIIVGLMFVIAVSWGENHRRRAATFKELLEKAEQQMAAMVPQEELDIAHEQVSGLAVRISELEERFTETKAPSQSSDETATGAEAGNMFLQMLDSAADQEAEDAKAKSPMQNMAKMFQGEQGEKLAEFSARAALTMQYGGIFDDLGLPPETEEQVKDIIVGRLKEQMTKGFERLEEGFDIDNVQEMQNELETNLRETLRADLSQVLTRDEMAIWEDYEDTKQERMLGQQYDMQLGMFAGGLTLENRELATQVIVEEILLMREEIFQPQTTSQPRPSFIEGQLNALTQARDRLALEFDDAQLAILDRFITQQEEMLQMSAEMFQGMTDQDE